jgi:sulfate transport system ATP-binding protein
MSVSVVVKGIRKSFGKEKVIDDLTLEATAGSVIAILGPSGCGKTTLLRVIAGLVEQDAGEVYMGKRRLDGVPVNQRNVGFVFQNYSLFPHMTVRRNVEFGLRIRGHPQSRMDDRVDELLELVGMGDLAEKRPGKLSGGQQQRVALVRALAPNPQVLLLDEPFGALDARIRRRIRRDLKKLQRKLGITTLFVTHDQEEAFEVGDEIAVMNKGRIEQKDLPRNLYEKPESLFVARFVGNANVMKEPGGNRKVMVRPEDLLLEKGGDDGVLVTYSYLGPLVEVTVDMGDGENVTALLTKADFLDRRLRRGDRLTVKLNGHHSLSLA